MEIFQFNDTYSFYMGVTGLVFWGLFCLRKVLGIGYKPYKDPYKAKTTVVVPSYKENEQDLRACLDSILLNKPDEIICVFNGELVGYEDRISKDYEGIVKFEYRQEADKRRAMIKGTTASSTNSEIVIFVDSDVVWAENTLSELVKPFKDKRVGGVATHQVISNADASVWTAIGSWLTHLGLTTGVAFQSKKLCASCLRGRTAAYRRKLLMTEGFLEEFDNEIFLGNRCRSGDDGRLTFLTLKYGYGTFVQSSAVVYTTLPEKAAKFMKHRLRCNRNTFRRYFGSITESWFWKQNWRFIVEFVASVIIPLGFITAVYALVKTVIELDIIYFGILFSWFNIGRLIRSPQWLRARPIRALKMPLMVLAFVGPLLVVRWYALFTLKEHEWGTR